MIEQLFCLADFMVEQESSLSDLCHADSNLSLESETGPGGEPAAETQNGGAAKHLQKRHSGHAAQCQEQGENCDSDGCKSKKPQHLLFSC